MAGLQLFLKLLLILWHNFVLLASEFCRHNTAVADFAKTITRLRFTVNALKTRNEIMSSTTKRNFSPKCFSLHLWFQKLTLITLKQDLQLE